MNVWDLVLVLVIQAVGQNVIWDAKTDVVGRVKPDAIIHVAIPVIMAHDKITKKQRMMRKLDR